MAARVEAAGSATGRMKQQALQSRPCPLQYEHIIEYSACDGCEP